MWELYYFPPIERSAKRSAIKYALCPRRLSATFCSEDFRIGKRTRRTQLVSSSLIISIYDTIISDISKNRRLIIL